MYFHVFGGQIKLLLLLYMGNYEMQELRLEVNGTRMPMCMCGVSKKYMFRNEHARINNSSVSGKEDHRERAVLEEEEEEEEEEEGEEEEEEEEEEE